jgi:hypothetical protein
MLFFLTILYELSSICFINIKCTIQDLQIIKLPYLSINNDTRNLNLRKLSFPSNVYGSAFGLNYYYTNLYLGENMEKQTYIIDTGSTTTTSPCTLCKKCGKHLNNYYTIDEDNNILCNSNKCKMVNSHCGSNNRCSFSVSYSEGSSLEGIYVNKLIRFGENYNSTEGKYAPIGCTTSENHLFLTQRADGIMGLAGNEYNFVSIMNKVGAIDNNIFGLCLAQMGGYFSMGEINTTFHREKISYVKMEKNSMFYNIGMKAILINGKNINSFKSHYQIIIDSGTTISYFPKEVFNEIVDITKSICNNYENKNACGKYEYDKDLGPCFTFDNYQKMEDGVLHYWPNFSFILSNNYNFRWNSEQYVFNDSNKKRSRACMGFNQQNGKFTMGSTWMIGHEVIFDIKNKKIGFAEANCDKNNNKSMDNMGIEYGYNYQSYNSNGKNSLFDIFLNENMLGIYIFITIILLFVLIYLILVLINFKKRKRNPWILFIDESDINKDESFIPIRYDINDINGKENNKTKEIDMIYLNKTKNKEFKNSNYSKISS